MNFINVPSPRDAALQCVGAHVIRFWLTKSGPGADGHIGVFGRALATSVANLAHGWHGC